VETIDDTLSSIVQTNTFHAISPTGAEGRFVGHRAYTQAGTTVFSRSEYTIGVVYQNIQESPNLDANTSLFLFEQDRGAGGATDGFGLWRQREGGANEKGRWNAKVGSTILDSNFGSAAASYTLVGPSELDGISMQALVVDTDAYPDDAWLHNGRRASSSVTWDDTGASTGIFALAGSTSDTNSTSEAPIIGLFFHLTAMSLLELRYLMLNIMRFKDIPLSDPTGYSTVPDHIWSVKRAMTVGSNGVASWVSDGATGGSTLTRVDSTLRVIELDGGLAAVR
jgi:hypothetical protein